MAGVIGFVGLDQLSLDMAALLLRAGYKVQAFEVQNLLMNEFVKLGGTKCLSLKEAGKGVAALIVLMSHVDQINDVIFGHDGALKELQKDAVIILYSTILPSHIQNLEKNLREDCLATSVVDAYVYKATSEHLNGKVVVTSSGRPDAISKAYPFLSAMSEKLYTFEGETGAGSKVKLVTELLEGIHLIASVEAIYLGVKAGIHPWIIYDIISNAAGNSWVFKNYIPQLLRGNVKYHFLNPFTQKLGIVLDMAKSLMFPLPLLASAHQQLVLGCSLGQGDDNAPLGQVWDQVFGVNTADAANAECYRPEELATEITSKSKTVKRVGFIGLGAMGFGMATYLVKSKFCVLGYDVYKPTLTRFESAGGLIGSSPADVSKDVDVLVVMVTNEAQAESVLFGDLSAVSALPSGASIILSSTVSPAFVIQLERRLQNEGKDLKLVDAPVSGGVKRASMGELTIMAAGSDDALKSAGLVLSALSEKLYIIKGGCGAGSGVKMVNQLLAGVHIAASAEAMAFGARLGLNTRMLFDIISNSGATSWMLENRVPHMLDNDYTPYSALDIFVKDLGIVARECSAHKVPLHISTIAHQLFIAGSAAGWGRQDDAGVVKVYETLTGVKVEGKLPALKKEAVLQSLPPEWPVDPINDIQRLNQKSSKTLVVLDDDPTGTQTVHDVEVLTEWSIESLIEQFRKKPTCFYILTNSRALSSEKATALIKDICSNLCSAAKSVGDTDYTVVLRGDSTLRGHFPEVEELQSQYGHMLKSIEVSVHKVAMESSEEREDEINRTAEMASVFLAARKDTLIMSSRELITGKTVSESLEINFKVSSALVEVVRRISTRPRYILAKGGITSSDLATKALEAKRAKVVEQALAGIPLWELGPESRHPGVPYIVFPGNVGDNKALAEVVRSWARPLRLSSTKEILINAEKGGYAVGAFNVYNMEGVEAVVAAAEQECSPAILQVHPGAFKQGGVTLVACCISAAEQASVPITLHYDHGTSKKELLESLELGFDSVMVDGSHLSFKDNISYTKHISNLAHLKDMLVEAELGRLSGTEDDLTVEDYEAKLTDINQAQEFIDETGIDALAVCIGNVHGKYPASGPNLKLDLLKDLYALSSKKGVFLVLHGASGLSEELVKGCIERGVRKFNVNTEVRKAYMESLSSPKGDLVNVMASAIEAMKTVVAEKMRLFGSAGKA